MNKAVKFIGIGCIGLFILVIIIGALGSGSSNTDNENNNKENILVEETNEQKTEESKQEEQKQEIIVIKASELADDFDDNQVAAEAKWKGKLVEFSAEISNITDNGLSFYDVATKEFSGTQISCDINDKDQLLTVKNGQVVKVQGVVGDQFIGVIDVNDCKIVE